MTEAGQLGVLTSIAQDHEDLLRHILGGDSKDAVEAMQQHVLASADRLLRDYPDDSTQDRAPDGEVEPRHDQSITRLEGGRRSPDPTEH